MTDVFVSFSIQTSCDPKILVIENYGNPITCYTANIKMWSYIVQGRHATQDEITACAYQAVNVDNKYNGAPVQVRVTMGKEPRHFLAIFKGKLIIYEVNYTYVIIC